MVTPRYDTTLRPAELAIMLGQDAAVRLLDLRTPAEFGGAHIRGAYNVPFDALSKHVAQISAIATPVVLVCQSGYRASRAELTLAAAGMPHLHVLAGGMVAWMSAGHPVVRQRPHVSLERQVRMVHGAVVASAALLALVVSHWFAVVPLLLGIGLLVSGITDTCTIGMLLARLPYNRAGACDTSELVRALRQGARPAGGDRKEAT
jgi:rhodanese-related sulfurtransferase